MTENKELRIKSRVFDMHVHSAINDKNSNISEAQLSALYDVYERPFMVVDSSIKNKWEKPNFIKSGREISIPIDAFKGNLSSQGFADLILIGWEEEYVKIDDENGVFNGEFDEFLEIYKNKKTALILAHPTRNFIYMDSVSSLPREIEYVVKMVDAIEAFNGKDQEYHHLMNYAIGTRFDKCMVAGSDAIYANKTYVEFTEFKKPVGSIEEIVEAIKYKEARPFINDVRAQRIASYMGIDLATKKQRKPNLKNRRLIE